MDERERERKELKKNMRVNRISFLTRVENSEQSTQVDSTQNSDVIAFDKIECRTIRFQLILKMQNKWVDERNEELPKLELYRKSITTEENSFRFPQNCLAAAEIKTSFSSFRVILCSTRPIKNYLIVITLVMWVRATVFLTIFMCLQYGRCARHLFDMHVHDWNALIKLERHSPCQWSRTRSNVDWQRQKKRRTSIDKTDYFDSSLISIIIINK